MATVEPSSHDVSMTAWARAASTRCGLNGLLLAVEREEAEKQARLLALHECFGLPIYDTRVFRVPEQCFTFLRHASDICRDGSWQLALRVTREQDGAPVYRQLGLTDRAAARVVADFGRDGRHVVVASPYRDPTRSGTLWSDGEQTVLELAFGPHTWLSKREPQEGRIMRCSLSRVCPFVRYSSDDAEERQQLYAALRSVVRISLGCSVGQLRAMHLPVYAEFHWHAGIGYRIIECSHSPVWTGSLLCPGAYGPLWKR